MDPYASVIIPTHDRAATLPTAVASVQRQTVSNIEILIVGDGPTSDIVAVAEALTGADSRVRFLAFDKAPRDGGVNVDRAVHEARSERIFYNDDDDVWLPQHVETIAPHLDQAHIADTLPVSVGTIPSGSSQRLHGTLVNSGNSRIRRLLAEDRLKLIFDTHIAHRKSSYIDLGSPWVTTSGIAVSHMLATFASASRVRWSTLPTTTALSLHGAARADATPMQRRTEIETWLARTASWAPDLLLQQVDFTWHSLRTWFAEAPLPEDTVANYLARYGITWDNVAACSAGNDNAALAIPLNERQRRAIGLAFELFQGHVGQEPPDSILLSLLDCVLGGGIALEFALRILKPCGVSTALKMCSRVRQKRSELSYPIVLLEAHLMLDAGKTAEARERAKLLARDAGLPPYDLTHLLVRCDLTEGAVGAAIGRLERAWLQRINPVLVGLELANLLINAARTSEAQAVCLDLKMRVPQHPLLERMLATIDHALAAQGSVPAYALSDNGRLLNPDGTEATISDEITGHIDGAHFERELVCVSGWAVDLERRVPVVRVVAILNGRAHGVAAPTIGRPDVVAALQLPGVEVSGYLLAARLPLGSTPSQTAVRVFAITADDAAGELSIPAATRGPAW